ncbi:MAG: DUF4440 domain-containing protein [Chthoniobacterales bacterium]
MKTTLLIAVTSYLASSLFTFAQDATPADQVEPSPAEPSPQTEPMVSVPSENGRLKFPRPGTSASTPAASPTPSPKPAAAPSSRPSATAAPKKNIEASLREIENKWVAAISRHDAKAVEALIAGDFIGVTSRGKIVNKAGLLAEIKNDTKTYQSVTNTRLDVRVHGAAAVVVGTTVQKGKNKEGKDFTYTNRWTDTWMERDGKWQCVASQSIQLAQ